MPATYAKVLDYTKNPLVNIYSATATLSQAATSRLQSLCRLAGISIGAGAFAPIGMVMMILHKRNQEQPCKFHELPCVAFFPVNARPFLTVQTTGCESSLMITFSDGLTLPLLPSDLDLEGHLKLLARQANQQLSIYQRRKPKLGSVEAETDKKGDGLGSRSASQMLLQLYLFTIDCEDLKLLAQNRSRAFNIQGSYLVHNGGSGPTCGVSSIGDRSRLIGPQALAHGHHNKVSREAESNEGDFAAFNFIGIHCTVRAHGGEFLVSTAGDKRGLAFNVDFDGNSIDPLKVRDEWKRLMEGFLDKRQTQEHDEGEGKGCVKRRQLWLAHFLSFLCA
jgi:hypothetical protein